MEINRNIDMDTLLASAIAAAVDEDITSCRFKALRGDFFDPNDLVRSPKWEALKRKILIFISSTFTDTHDERNILLLEILSSLRDRARPLGIEIIMLDLRSGIPDASTLEHDTWVGCEYELVRCFNESAGLFFLSLQGDKYGYMMLPKTIDQGAFERRLSESDGMTFSKPSSELRDLAAEWYQLDTNAQPAVYVLRSLSGDRNVDKLFWSDVQPQLCELFHGVVFDYNHPDCIVGHSVTEYEFKTALSLSKEGLVGLGHGTNGGGDGETNMRKGIRWLRRIFDGGVRLDQDERQRLFDAHESATRVKLDDLHDCMHSALEVTALSDTWNADESLISTLSICVEDFSDKNSSAYKVMLEEFIN